MKSVNKIRSVRPKGQLCESVENYWKLLDEFSSIPEYVLDRTLMDISGYPHYENVCSNILAFYFDPSNEHGMGDLLIQSFLDCFEAETNKGKSEAGRKSVFDDRPVFEEVSVSREVGTRSGKRLDLLIESDELIIGIENKVYHAVGNPFDEYDALIKSRDGGDRKSVNVILALNYVKEEAWHHGFVSITYREWFKRLSEIMGPYLLDAEPKYQHYFFDFMKTMKRLGGDIVPDEKVNEFFKANHVCVEGLLAEYAKFKKGLAGEIATLRLAIPKGNYPKIHQWVHRSSCLVHDFKVKSGTIAIDTQITPVGWKITLWNRRGAVSALEVLVSAMEQEFCRELRRSVNRYVIAEFELSGSSQEVLEILEKSIMLIEKAILENPDLSPD